MSEICVHYGNNPFSPIGFMYYAALTLAAANRDYETARHFGELAIKLYEKKYPNKASEATLMNLLGVFISPYTDTLANSRKYLLKGYYVGLENG